MFNEKLIFKNNVYVHCDTEEKANQLLQWANEQGINWMGSDLPTTIINYWDANKDKTCYCISKDGCGMDHKDYMHSSLKIYKFEEVHLVGEALIKFEKDKKDKKTRSEIFKLFDNNNKFRSLVIELFKKNYS